MREVPQALAILHASQGHSVEAARSMRLAVTLSSIHISQWSTTRTGAHAHRAIALR